jgi:hypothetical protein
MRREPCRVDRIIDMALWITDVTEIHHGNFCAAGWDAAKEQMVHRPMAPTLHRSNFALGGISVSG